MANNNQSNNKNMNDVDRVFGTSGYDIVRHRCAGLDVHKKTVVCAILIYHEIEKVFEIIKHTYSSNHNSLQKMCNWLIDCGVNEVCMESTGIYWHPVWNALEQNGLKPFLTHPKYVKAVRDAKSDWKDAEHIAHLFALNIPKMSFIPPEDIRKARTLARYEIKLNAVKTSEKNRIQNCMTVSGIRLDNIFTDPFGKSASNVLNALLDGTELNENNVQDFVDRKCKCTVQEVLDSVEGFRISTDQKLKLELAKDHLKHVDEAISRCDEMLAAILKPYAELIGLIKSIPGISDRAAMFILCEIGTDMDVFKSAARLTCWAGLTPGLNSSAKKHHSRRCSMGDHYLKPILVQCALAASRSKYCPYYRIKYQHLLKHGVGKKKAVVAIARMMLSAVFYVLKSKTQFDPSDYDDVVNPKKSERVKLNNANVCRFAAEHVTDTAMINKLGESFYVNSLKAIGLDDQTLLKIKEFFSTTDQESFTSAS